VLVHSQPLDRNAAIDMFCSDIARYEVYQVTPTWFYILIAVEPDFVDDGHMAIIHREVLPGQYPSLFEAIYMTSQLQEGDLEEVERRRLSDEQEARREDEQYENALDLAEFYGIQRVSAALSERC
jgi:hypothetical protein